MSRSRVRERERMTCRFVVAKSIRFFPFVSDECFRYRYRNEGHGMKSDTTYAMPRASG